MKKNLLNVLIAVILFLIPNLNFGQVPTLGTTANFALFTKAGALTNGGTSNITGDIGSFDTSPVGFPGSGSVIGTIYAVGDPALTQAAADVSTAYGSFGVGGVVLGTPFENQTLSPGEYYTIGAAALNGNLTLDGGGDANAIFIIKVNGALSIGTISSNVILIGSASLCNVYWQVNGDFTLANSSVFRGTLVSNGAITLSGSSTIFGRALTTAGAINTSAITVTITAGCGDVGTPVFTLGATSSRYQGAGTVTYTATATNTTGITYSLDATTAAFSGNSIVASTGEVTYAAGWSGTTTITASAAGTNGPTTATHTVTICPTVTISAGSSTTFCAGGNVILSGNVGGTWSTGAVTPTITVTEAGDYYVTSTNSCGVSNSNHIVVTVTPLPTASAITAGGATTFCDGNSVVLSGNVGGTWSTGAVTPTITVTAAGDYFVTNTNGCGSVTSNHIAVTVTPLATASAITAGGATTFCEGANVVLSGNVDGVWSNGLTTPSITVNTSGDYFVTNANGCGSVISNHIVVTVTPLPTASAITAGGATTFCDGNNVILSGNVGGTWSTGAVTPTITVTAAGDYFVTNTNGCGSVTSNHIAVTVTPLATASAITAGGATTFCEGANVVLSGNVDGVWSNGLTTPSITVNTSGDYFVTNANGCGSVISNHIVVTVNPLPIASVITASDVTTFCEGSSVVLSGNVGGTWSTGATTPTITVTIAGDYFVTNANGCGSVISNHIIVTVNPLPIASVISAGGATTFCANENVVLSGNVDGVWSNGLTTPSITVNTSGDYFVTNANGCGSLTSNHILVTVNPLPIASVITASDVTTFCEGSSVVLSGNVGGIWSTGAATPTLTVTTSGEYFVTNTNGCGSTISNHIIVTVNPLPTASVITAGGATTFCLGGSVILSGNIGGIWSNESSSSTITVTTSGDYFVTNTNECGDIISNHILVTVNPLPLAITGIDESICAGNSTVIGASEVVGHTYLWTPSIGLSSNVIANPVASPSETTTYMLTETITASGCQMSNSVTVTVNPLPIASVISAGGATTFCANENVVLSGNVDGIWSNGLTTPSITVNTPGDYFVTNANGCGSLTSNHILVTVNPIPEAITGIDANICLGDVVTLGASSTAGHTYLWSPVTGLSSSTISNPVALTPVTTTYTLTETITATGCQNSNSVAVLVNTNPSITLQPTNETICIGSSAHFTVEVTGTGLTYQWRNGAVNLTDGGNISGTNTATLTINPVSITDAALNYNVVVSGTCSLKETSMNVSLAVNVAPSITIEPVDQTVCAVGGSASFWVDAIGTDLTYQWKRGDLSLNNGENISGANTAMLTINPVEIGDVASDYNVAISGTCSPIVTSLDASLSICNTTAIVTPDKVNNVVSFFPNPFKASISMLINDSSDLNSCELRVYNILGEMVFNTTVTKQLTTINTSNFPSGTYIYKVIVSNKIIQLGKLISQ